MWSPFINCYFNLLLETHTHIPATIIVIGTAYIIVLTTLFSLSVGVYVTYDDVFLIEYNSPLFAEKANEFIIKFKLYATIGVWFSKILSENAVVDANTTNLDSSPD